MFLLAIYAYVSIIVPFVFHQLALYHWPFHKQKIQSLEICAHVSFLLAIYTYVSIIIPFGL